MSNRQRRFVAGSDGLGDRGHHLPHEIRGASIEPIPTEPEGHADAQLTTDPARHWTAHAARRRCPLRSRPSTAVAFYCSFYCAARYGLTHDGSDGLRSNTKLQLKGTHNPKVVGSNPTPATICRSKGTVRNFV